MSVDTEEELVTPPDYAESDGGPPPAPEPEGGGERPQPVLTAFLVLQALDGGWFASPDLSIASSLDVGRMAGNYDLTAGCSCVLRDVAAAQVAGELAKLQAMLAQRAANAEEEARIREMMNRSPNREDRRHPR